MAAKPISSGNSQQQVVLLINQIDALSKTILQLNENISNELEWIENGQLYFILAKVKSKCEQLKDRQTIVKQEVAYSDQLPKAENVTSKNSGQPFQRFLQKYQDVFSISDVSQNIQDSMNIEDNDQIKQNPLWKKDSDRCKGNYFALDCNQDTFNQKDSTDYYDKSKSFFDNISNNDQLRKINNQVGQSRKKNRETFGRIADNLSIPTSHVYEDEKQNRVILSSKGNSFHNKVNKVPTHLRQLASECVELLSASDEKLSFKDFVRKYYERFGYNVEDVEKKQKLLELLQDMPSVVSLRREPNSELFVELVKIYTK